METLLAQGRARAEAEALTVSYQVADAEQLPFETATFDGVVSTFGVMFAPNQLKAASEMLRVCRPGGRIGMANWTPEGFIGSLFKSLGKHVAPPAGLSSPALWGSKPWIQDVFASKARTLTINDRTFVFRYPSPEHFVKFFRTYYGPVHKAFLALDAARTGRAGSRSRRAHRAFQHGNRWHYARPRRLRRGRHHKGLTSS